MSFRYLLARAQWALGVVVCVVVALVVVTSAMVANEAQPNQRALRDVRSPPTNGCQALAMGELPGKDVRKGTGSLLVTSATKVDRWEPALIRLSDGAPVHLDPYKGMVMGDASGRMQRFLRSVLHWHRWLAMHSEAREVGWVITAWAKQFDCALGRQAYETVGRCGFWELGLGRPIRHWLSLTHTSDMGEAVGQPVTGGVSLGACVMGWPGLTLA